MAQKVAGKSYRPNFFVVVFLLIQYFKEKLEIVKRGSKFLGGWWVKDLALKIAENCYSFSFEINNVSEEDDIKNVFSCLFEPK